MANEDGKHYDSAAETFLPNKSEGLQGHLPINQSPKYDLGKEIGIGGMGKILTARDRRIQRWVAMKVLLDETESRERRERFIQEARITGQLEHPNIVPVHEIDLDENGRPYYTMKQIAGSDLEGVLKQIREQQTGIVQQYPLARLLAIFQKTCDAVAFAHSRGFVHRDLKPANIMVGDFGEVLVIDWGLAKAIGSPPDSSDSTGRPASDSNPTAQGDTLEGQVMGTPAFMAPEQAEGKVAAIDQRTDIYALGGILFSILTLQLPVTGASRQEVLEKIKRGEICAPVSFNRRKAPLPHCPGGKVPKGLSAVAMKALSVKQKTRYQTVKELQTDIEVFLGGFPTSAQKAGLGTRLTLMLKRHKKAAAALLAFVLLLAAFSVTVFALQLKRKVDAQLAAEKAQRREVFLQEAREARAMPQEKVRQYRWSSNSLDRALRAGGIAFSNDVVDEVAATLGGLDVSLVYSAVSNSASSFSFHPERRQLLIGGSRRRPGRAPTRVLDLTTLDAPRSIGPPADGPVTWGDAIPRQFIWSPADEAPVRVNLQTSRARSFTWPFEIRTNLLAHPLAMSSDGKWMATGYLDIEGNGGVAIWHQDSQAPVASATIPISALAFSPDGTFLAVGTPSGSVKVWSLVDVESQRTLSPERPLATFLTEGGRIDSLAFGPDLRTRARPDTNASRALLLAAGDSGGTIAIWELATNRPPRVMHGSQHNVYAIAFSPDATVLASGGRTELHFWDTATGRELLRLGSPGFGQPTAYVMALAFSPDGRFLASGSPEWSFRGQESHTYLFELEWSRGIRQLHGLSAIAERVWWSQDGKLIAGLGHNWRLGVWDAASGRLIRIFETPEGRLADNSAAAFDPSGTRLAFATGLEARLWKLPSGDVERTWHLPFGLGDWMAFTTNGARLLLLRREKPEGSRKEIQWRLRDLLRPDGKTLILQDTHRLLLDNDLDEFRTNGIPTNITYHTAYGGQLSTDGRFFVRADHWRRGTNNGWYGQVVETDTGRSIWETFSPVPIDSSWGCRFDPNGQMLSYTATSGKGTMVITLPSCQELRREPMLGAFNTALTWTVYGGANASGASDGAVLHELGGRSRKVTVGLGTGHATYPEMSPNGRLAAWGSASGAVLVVDIDVVWRRLMELGLVR